MQWSHRSIDGAEKLRPWLDALRRARSRGSSSRFGPSPEQSNEEVLLERAARAGRKAGPRRRIPQGGKEQSEEGTHTRDAWRGDDVWKIETRTARWQS